MKWTHDHREPVRYGLTPAAFPELALLLIFAFFMFVLPWLFPLIWGWFR